MAGRRAGLPGALNGTLRLLGARLHVDAPLRAGEPVELDRAKAHYLLNVMRLKADDEILVFNGRDGEWLCRLDPSGRKAATFRPVEMVRPQPDRAPLDYLFAPLKHARLDYMAQKAVEMGLVGFAR